MNITTSSQIYVEAEHLLAQAREASQRMRNSLTRLVHDMVHSCSEGDTASVYWAAEKYARLVSLDGVSVDELRDAIRKAKGGTGR